MFLPVLFAIFVPVILPVSVLLIIILLLNVLNICHLGVSNNGSGVVLRHSAVGPFYARQGMEGRVLWFHVVKLLNGRYQGGISEQQETAQRASCQTAFKRAVSETNGARRESYRC